MVPRIEPPERPPATPLVEKLSPGAGLFRVHSSRFAAHEFNPTVATAYAGGRFDSPEGEYAHLYVCDTPSAAIAEAFLRTVPYDDAPRQLPRAVVANLALSRLVVRTELPLAALHGPGLSRIGQDAWLTSCEALDYTLTRAWAKRVRAWAPECCGLVWRPRHANDDLAYVLYSDRIPPNALEVASRPLPLDSGNGFVLLRRVLRNHGVSVSA